MPEQESADRQGLASGGSGSATAAPTGSAASAGGNYRWAICGLLFAATTINYIDRQILGILKPELQGSLGWTEIDFANLVFWFQAAYAAGFLLSGRLVDRIGSRIGLALSVVAWSLAEMAHAMVRSVTGFCGARFCLGLAEGGNFPAAIKSVSEWFPQKERALATGIFNSGSNVGGLIAPFLVPWITLRWGWPMAFVVTGGLGFVWLIFWMLLYDHPRRHPRLSPSERAYIMSDLPPTAAHVPWLKLLGRRQTWAFATGMFMTAPVAWFYLNWIPDFLHKHYGLALIDRGPPLVVISLITCAGSIGGGWISSTLIHRGWGVHAARKTAFLICGLCVVPVFATPWASQWTAVLLVGLASAAHMGFAANLFTMVSDTVPHEAISSVVGIGGMMAGVGGMCSAKIIGAVLDLTGSYHSLFFAVSMIYPVALLIMHLWNPRYEAMKLRPDDEPYDRQAP